MVERKLPLHKGRESIAMELLVKTVIVCVIFTSVFAVEQHNQDEHNSTKLYNLAEHMEARAAKLRKHIVDCTEETKINPNMIISIRSGKWRLALRNEPQQLKEWFLCVLVKFGIMSPDGVLRQDEVLAYVPAEDRDNVEKAIDKCLYGKPHLPVDIAWHYVTCFRNRFSKYSIV